MNKNNFWHHFESVPGGKALLQVWQEVFGAEFRLVQPFLQATPERGGLYPCPRNPPCDCDHEVREDFEGEFVAVCTCGDGGCAPIKLSPEGALIYELNRRALGNAICGALGLDMANRTITPNGGSLEIGSYAPLHAPVFLCFPANAADLLRELEELLSRGSGPFVILTPTRAHIMSVLDNTVDRCGSAILALSVIVEPHESAGFRATKALAPALAQWTDRVASLRGHGKALEKVLLKLATATDRMDAPIAKEQDVPEEVAIQAFALVKALDSEEASRLGPPSVPTVFRLYCMEELSSSEIAKRVGCAKLTVLRRLQLIRARTGMDPSTFRRFSSQFAKIEEQMRDPRAAHIHRKRMIDDEGQEDE